MTSLETEKFEWVLYSFHDYQFDYYFFFPLNEYFSWISNDFDIMYAASIERFVYGQDESSLTINHML